MKLENLGEALRAYRGDMTQRDVAKKTGLTVNYLSLLETGKRVPSLTVLIDLAKVYNVRVSDIVKFAEDVRKGCHPW